MSRGTTFQRVTPRLFLDETRRRRALTPRAITQVEKRLGVRLPDAYLSVLQQQNGGDLKRDRLVVDPQGDAAAYTVPNLLSVGGDNCISLYTMKYRDDGLLNDLCVLISSGETPVFLDYRDEGPNGEPTIVCGTEEYDDEVAQHFGDFVSMLRMYDWRYVFGLSTPVEMDELARVLSRCGLRIKMVGEPGPDELVGVMSTLRGNTEGEPASIGIERHFRRDRADKPPLHPELVGCKWIVNVNVEKRAWPRVAAKLDAALPGELFLLCEPLERQLRVPHSTKKKARAARAAG
jgi:hypothetical protein